MFPFDASPSASGDAVGALESESDEVEEEGGLESCCSVLTTSAAAGWNLASWEEGSLSLIMRDLAVVEDFLDRAPLMGVEGEALCAPAMVGWWWCCRVCWEANREGLFFVPLVDWDVAMMALMILWGYSIVEDDSDYGVCDCGDDEVVVDG